MKKKQLFLFLGLCSAGLVSGYTAKRLGSPAPAAASGSSVAGTSGDKTANGQNGKHDDASTSRGSTTRKEIKPSTLRSEDTLESLKALEGPELYGRLALWMVDASEQDINGYWDFYRQKKGRDNDINDLIFINWTRINPQGATAATKGTPDEHYAWWAWACHDPKGALQSAIATNPNRINNVTWGIGEFHPDWLREHYDELPEENRGNALSGMEKWDDKGDPLETLKFLEKNGRGFNAGIFKVLVLRDPWAAYDFIQERGNKESHIYSPYGGSSNLMETFVNMVADNHPDVLKRIADNAPSGEMKRKLEAKVFANLLAEDPEAAMEQARETKAPAIASQRLAAIGMSYVSTDPDKAFAMAEELFSKSPNAMNSGMRIDLGNSSSSWGGTESAEVGQLIHALFAKDPARLFDLKMPKQEEGQHYSGPLHQLGYQWAEQDLEGFGAWAGKQTEPATKMIAASIMINKLQQEQNFADAAEWAMSVDSKEAYIGGIYSQWKQTAPEEADAWLESADLPEKFVSDLKSQPRAHQ